MLSRFRGQLARLVVHAAGILCTALPATAGVEVIAQQCTIGGAGGVGCMLYEIHISGPIDEKAVGAFARAAEDSRLSGKGSNIGPRPPRVMLNSLGGSVPAAMGLGDAIRRHGFSTWVNGQDECSSACVLVLAAGVRRSPSGRIGIHRPHFDHALFGHLSQEQAHAKYDQMADGVRDYLARMGMDAGLYAAMLRVPSDEIRILSPQEIRAYGLEGEDPAWAEWTRAKGIETEGLENYIFHKTLAAVLNARCSIGEEGCHQEVESALLKELRSCSGRIGSDYVACAKTIERRFVNTP
jgi:ATP-dependent protease ClpP protease subunit